MERYHLGSEFKNPSKLFEYIVGRVENNPISKKKIVDYYSDKRILIVGAGGTIGSSVARRLVLSGIEDVYFLDRDESALHALALGLSDSAASHSEKCIVSDIKDYVGIKLILEKYKPDLIIHAAALKHLVVLERFPREGFMTNVSGTFNLLKAASESGVKQFVNVSTDKAANPTSFLGKTKKITERLTNSFHGRGSMNTCSVRFGNVFASRGSVIETFFHQIENGLPVTLTDSKVTRYFMSHDEAASLILSAGLLADNGVFVQNMGEEVKMTQVIERIASYLKVQYTINQIGLQPGEKMNEELYADLFVGTSIQEIVRVNVEAIGQDNDVFKLYQNPRNDAEALEFTEILLGM